MASQYGQMFLEAAAKRQAQNEADAKARTFDVGKIIPALITSIATANPTPLILAGTGEAARASTGSSTDIASLATLAGQQFLPQQAAAPTQATDRTALMSQSRLADAPAALRGDMNPIESSFGNMGRNFGTMPVSNEQANVMKYIKDMIPSKTTYQGVEFTPTLAQQYGQLFNLGNNQAGNAKRLYDPKNPGKYAEFDMSDPNDLKQMKLYLEQGWR